MTDAVWKLRLETLEQIETCGTSLLRQAGHLSKLLALPDGGTDHEEADRLLRELDALLVLGDPKEQAACVARLRRALRLPTP
jgi:hypothetical protein